MNPATNTESTMTATASKKPRAAKRTDVHRPGAIIPTDYQPVLAYYFGKGLERGMGVNCASDFGHYKKDENGVEQYVSGEHAPGGYCCLAGLREIVKVKFAEVGGAGSCSVCKAHFSAGEVWRHVPTGEHIHLGHDCAMKYELFADDPEWTAKLAMIEQHRKALIEERARSVKFDAFVRAYPFLADVLEMVDEKGILADMKNKVRKYGSLSEKQIDFACSVASRMLCPARPPRAADVNVRAPEGRVVVEGIVISKKLYESDFGSTFKVTVKAISSQGVSCTAAYKFLALQFKNTTSTAPEGYKCKSGRFKVPVGSVAEVCTKPGAKIQYAGPGG